MDYGKSKYEGKLISYKRCRRRNYLPKSYMDVSIIFIVCLILILNCVQGKLHLTKQCGEIVCQPHYYCSSFDHICRPCQETCDRTLSNYDEDLCEKDCQDYLHDLLYMRKSHNESSSGSEMSLRERVFFDDIQQELLTLKILIMVTIIISTSIMLVLFFLVIYLNRSRNRLGIRGSWCWGKNETVDLPVIYSNSKCITFPRNINEAGNNQSIKGNGSIVSRVSTPDVISRSGNVKSKSTSILSVNKLATDFTIKNKGASFRREPSESTLPDYLGYDNPALCVSPTPTTRM